MYSKKKQRCFPEVLIILLVFFLAGWMDPFQDHVSEGNSRFHDRDYPAALEKYKKAEKYAPSKEDEKKLAFNRGDAEYGAGNYDKAVMEYKRALEADDPNIQKKAFLNLGNSYLEMKKYREAVDSYMNALKIDPSYARAKNNLEYLLKMKDKKQDQKKNNDKDDKKDDKKDNKKDEKKDKSDDRKKDTEQQKNKQQQPQRKMSREQVKNILESMKNKPVRRQKGTSNERHNLEKNW